MKSSLDTEKKEFRKKYVFANEKEEIVDYLIIKTCQITQVERKEREQKRERKRKRKKTKHNNITQYFQRPFDRFYNAKT